VYAAGCSVRVRAAQPTRPCRRNLLGQTYRRLTSPISDLQITLGSSSGGIDRTNPLKPRWSNWGPDNVKSKRTILESFRCRRCTPDVHGHAHTSVIRPSRCLVLHAVPASAESYQVFHPAAES
jgi:hypothetical protein